VEVELAADGEILVRGPNVFGRYWARPGAPAAAFCPSGDGGAPWFRTGDLGTVDDGYLTIRGRSKELIISGGFNVYPSEVEDVVITCPGVAEVAVTGTPSDEWGEVVTAWIVADGHAPSAEVLSGLVADRLASYKRPRIVHVVDALPRNALGKLVRSELGR
jgi:acyl-CoA synthetase (AMP-forming)/AMP-acid ligase II